MKHILFTWLSIPDECVYISLPSPEMFGFYIIIIIFMYGVYCLLYIANKKSYYLIVEVFPLNPSPPYEILTQTWPPINPIALSINLVDTEISSRIVRAIT